jgi:hypothetical protein
LIVSESDDDDLKQNAPPLDLMPADKASPPMSPGDVNAFRPLIHLSARQAARDWFRRASATEADTSVLEE